MFSSPKEFEVPPDWIYRGEGNCNVVIALLKQRKILRVRKTNKGKSLLSWLINWITDIFYWYCGNGPYEELRDLKFYKKVIRPLLGSNFVCEGEQVFLSKKQIKILEDQLDHQRPDYRKNKSFQYGRAALFDDYAFLPDEYYPFLLSDDTFAIEIKPKQGWVPFSEKHFPKCIFCMNQYLKRAKGQTRALSSYCPLDLFSGESSRMISALKSLINNPQNNLRIFKNGKLCYGEDCNLEAFHDFVVDFFRDGDAIEDLTDEFCSLIQRCLLTNFETTERPSRCKEKLFCEWNKIIQENSAQNRLPKGCVLERILSVQMLDVEGNQYYYKLLGSRSLKDFDYVKSLLDEVDRCESACLKCTIMMLGDRRDDVAFAPYLISAIAKDCSLMLTFQKVVEPLSDCLGMKNVVRTKCGYFVVNIGVFDLYPKPLSTVQRHRKKFKKIFELYMENETK